MRSGIDSPDLAASPSPTLAHGGAPGADHGTSPGAAVGAVVVATLMIESRLPDTWPNLFGAGPLTARIEQAPVILGGSLERLLARLHSGPPA